MDANNKPIPTLELALEVLPPRALCEAEAELERQTITDFLADDLEMIGQLVDIQDFASARTHLRKAAEKIKQLEKLS